MLSAVKEFFGFAKDSGSSGSSHPNEKNPLVEQARRRLESDCHNLLALTQALIEGPPRSEEAARDFSSKTKGLKSKIEEILSVTTPERWEVQVIRLETGVREICLPQIDALLHGGQADPPSVILDKLGYCAQVEIKYRPSSRTAVVEKLSRLQDMQSRLHQQVHELRGHLFVRGYRI